MRRKSLRKTIETFRCIGVYSLVGGSVVWVSILVLWAIAGVAGGGQTPTYFI